MFVEGGARAVGPDSPPYRAPTLDFGRGGLAGEVEEILLVAVAAGDGTGHGAGDGDAVGFGARFDAVEGFAAEGVTADDAAFAEAGGADFELRFDQEDELPAIDGEGRYRRHHKG